MIGSFETQYRNPLVIDIGSDTVKFTQMINSIADIKEIIDRDSKFDSETNSLTPNNIFELDCFTKSFPTSLLYSAYDSNQRVAADNFFDLMKLYRSNAKDKIQSKFDQDIKLYPLPFPDYTSGKDSRNFELESLRFQHETMFAGIIDQNSDGEFLEMALRMIGESHDPELFSTKLFEETPLVLGQNSFDYETLKKKNICLIEQAFETFKAPQMMICSNALLNVLSFNLPSGLVIDWAESALYITPVLNGFTLYDKAIHVPFLSFRNCKLIKYFREASQRAINQNVKYSSYYKHSYFPEDDKSDDSMDDSEKTNMYHQIAMYPEIFKLALQTNDLDLRLSNLETCEHFIANYEAKGSSEGLRFMKYDSQEFKIKKMSEYVNSNSVGNRLEKTILSNKLDFAKKEVEDFKQLSIAHYAIFMIEKLINEDFGNAISYLSVVLTGGGFSVPGMKEKIKSEIQSLINKGNIDLSNTGYTELPNIIFKDDSIPTQKSFSKGANLLTKINNISELMIDRQSYFEHGAVNLSISYT